MARVSDTTSWAYYVFAIFSLIFVIGLVYLIYYVYGNIPVPYTKCYPCPGVVIANRPVPYNCSVRDFVQQKFFPQLACPIQENNLH